MKTEHPGYEWLLEEENPSVRYRTMTALLDRNEADPGVADAKNLACSSQMVKQILSKMHPDGYWLQKMPRTGEYVGAGVEYGAYASTHFCLSYLAELGLNIHNARVSQAVDRYLNLQQADGDFYRHFSCLYAYNIRTFIMLGLREDPRVQRSIDLMLSTERLDGGYLCDMHEGKYKTKAVKSCIRGSVKALLAFSELPEYWEHPRCQSLVDYFINRDVLFRTSDLSEPINHDVTRTSFPITWRASINELVYAFSKMGYGNHPRLRRAWEVLESKRDKLGRYRLDWAPSQALLKPGKRGAANKWITYYALLAKKYQASS